MRFEALLLALPLSLLLGCPLGSDDKDKEETGEADADTDADTDTDTDTDGPTCYDVQMGTYVDGDTVTLQGVIATTDDSGYSFFVQDPGGGEYHCLYIYLAGPEYDITRGDQLTVTGVVKEYHDLTEITIDDTAGSVEVTGSGSVTVDTLASAPTDWEPWEGCLVAAQNMSVVAASDYGEFETNWGVNIDDLFYAYEGAVPADYTSITGAVNYGYEAFKLEPRGAGDLAN